MFCTDAQITLHLKNPLTANRKYTCTCMGNTCAYIPYIYVVFALCHAYVLSGNYEQVVSEVENMVKESQCGIDCHRRRSTTIGGLTLLQSCRVPVVAYL